VIQHTLGNDLRQLDLVTFEVEEINDLGLDAPAVVVGDELGEGGELSAWSSSSCSCSSCCSCSTSSCCSCSTSCGSTSSCG
jgi:hypothetical protein